MLYVLSFPHLRIDQSNEKRFFLEVATMRSVPSSAKAKPPDVLSIVTLAGDLFARMTQSNSSRMGTHYVEKCKPVLVGIRSATNAKKN